MLLLKIKKNWLNKKESLSKKFFVKYLFYVSIYGFFLALNLIKPDGDIKYLWHWGIWFPITTWVIVWEGRHYFKIYRDLFKKILDMNFLIGLGSHILYLYSTLNSFFHWNDSIYSFDVMWEGPAALILITNLGKAVENKIRLDTSQIYDRLNKMQDSPTLKWDGSKTTSLFASQIQVGEQILVRMGDMVPLDGILKSEFAEIDLSNINGESKISKIMKDQNVISGSYNLGQAIILQVSHDWNNSTISKIVNSIEDVSMSRPKLQKISDRILKYFIPMVILLALVTFALWTIIPQFTNWHFPWIHSTNIYINALKAAVTVIAIACPCALGIATPLVYTVSSMLLVENGVVVNQPESLENFAKIKCIVFDKTGTLTMNELDLHSHEGDMSFLPMMKALENNIDHPLARSILALPGEINQEISEIHYLPSQGVQGVWRGKKIEVKAMPSKEQYTKIALFLNNEPKLILNFKNQLRKGTKETISYFHKQGISTVMLTGDQTEVANSIAREVGIQKVFAKVTPTQKSEIINNLSQQGIVAFVGDGFNDSIAMKRANISLAFASGSDITNSLADISILNDDFLVIKSFFKISQKNNSRVKIALFYAFLFNVITIPIAMILLVPPWGGAIIMASSDVLVALHSWLYKIQFQKKRKKIK